MKNQYVGDIGDYGKYGLLRFLSGNGITVGVNWYLTDNDGSSDGKYTEYLKGPKDPKLRSCDEQLFDELGSIAFRKDKSVSDIEESGILPGAKFHNEILQKDNRSEWHKKALEAMVGAELVFCDPDNGLAGGRKPSKGKAAKYVFPKEIAEYYLQGQNVVYYCHKGRRKMADWDKAKARMKRELPEAMLYALTYHRGTQRSYIFVLHPEDYSRYVSLLQRFIKETKWGSEGHFTEEEIVLL